MFVAWKITPISTRRYRQHERHECPHGKTAATVRWTPMLCVSERVDGKPRRRVVYRLGVSIRSCCAAEVAAPFFRAYFWRDVLLALLDAPPEAREHFEAIHAAIAARVPRPTFAEQQIAAQTNYSWNAGRDNYENELKRWEAARRAYEKPRGEGSRQQPQRLSFPPLSLSALGLRWPTTREAITKAYRALAVKHHPDRGGEPAAMVKINQARDEALAYLDQIEARTGAAQ
jgi:hypothetical protein